MRNLGKHFNKRAHLMQLILLTHEVKKSQIGYLLEDLSTK
jgi:hypothetical protein